MSETITIAPTTVSNGTNGASKPVAQEQHAVQSGKGFEMGQGELAALTSPPKFNDFESERAYLKERLVASLRIFAKLGFDHHVVSSASRVLQTVLVD